eukprot:Nk52_evm1s901 gene=Nk52_evmTU1s901
MGMAITCVEGSTVTHTRGFDGQVRVSDMTGVEFMTEIALHQIQGQVNDYHVALDVSQTEFQVDISGMDPGAVYYFEMAIQQYFIDNFVDSNYILGTVFFNPDGSNILNDMVPKTFKMKTIPDVWSSKDGDGFLALFIMTTTSEEIEDRFLHVPPEFNLVPDGSTTALYISNKLFYTRVLPVSMQSGDFKNVGYVLDYSRNANNPQYRIQGGILQNSIMTHAQVSQCKI